MVPSHDAAEPLEVVMFLDMREYEEKEPMKTGSRFVSFEGFGYIKPTGGKPDGVVTASFLSRDGKERFTEYFGLKSLEQVNRLKAFIRRLHEVLKVKQIPVNFDTADSLVKWGMMIGGSQASLTLRLKLEAYEVEGSDGKKERREKVVMNGRFTDAMDVCDVVFTAEGEKNA